jgi:hypothetical protein
MAVVLTYRILLIIVIALIAIILLGVLLGLGILCLVAALVYPMSAKWKFALLVVGIILITIALLGRLF